MTGAERVFPAQTKHIPEMIAFVAGIAESMEVHPKRIMHLELAVEEAVINICQYAYKVPPGDLLISVAREENRFIVVFVDSGVPFDPLALETPDIKADIGDREIGGLGIFLIRRIMDEVHYKRQGPQNILTLVVNG